MEIDPRRIEVMDDRVAEIMRRKTPAEKLAMASGMWRSAYTMVYHSLKQQNESWSEDELKRQTARRMLRGTG
jgi:hypothetical protein